MARGAVVLACIAFLACLGAAHADTPANCTYADVQGKWIFFEGPRAYDRFVNCSNFTEADATQSYVFDLLFPNIALDSDGMQGTWTFIYNQGFEVIMPYRRYFAFSYYTTQMLPNGSMLVDSICNATWPGWAHTNTQAAWSCWTGSFMGPIQPQVDAARPEKRHVLNRPSAAKWPISKAFVDHINKHETLWKASTHEALFGGLTFAEMQRRAGAGTVLPPGPKPKPAPITAEHKRLSAELPENFDWRNVDGINYVSPIRNQGSCGSCYAFGSSAMMEARVRVLSNLTYTPIFSPQDIVSCSNYSQGCEGGFPYLIAGKYGTDFGLVEEECNTYIGNDTATCGTNQNCTRWYTDKYYYVGGFYGACNEPLMRAEIAKNGPLAISFEVTPEFPHYTGGIYRQNYTLAAEARTVALKADGSSFDPFQLTNHVVAIVGWGVENDVKYWTVKNSWGATWGENGYFRIVRGIDELAIESIAAAAIPLLP
jgi:cathepsin C